eukprot:s1659_g4.t1
METIGPLAWENSLRTSAVHCHPWQWQFHPRAECESDPETFGPCRACLGMAGVRLALFAALSLLPVYAQEFAIGVYAPVTSRSQLYMALTAIFDLDLRKNFEPALVTRFGAPIIDIAAESGVPLQPGLANIRPRIGTSNSQTLCSIRTFLSCEEYDVDADVDNGGDDDAVDDGHGDADYGDYGNVLMLMFMLPPMLLMMMMLMMIMTELLLVPKTTLIAG